MNCNDFIANHETGSIVARTRARLHAQRCAKCAATRDRLVQLRNELSTPAEISSNHRRIWERAALAEAPVPVRHWAPASRFALAGGLAVAAAIIVMLVLSLINKDEVNDRNVATIPKQPRESTVVTVALRTPQDQIDELELGLNEVATDLDRLANAAARLEARRDLSDLAAMYQSLGPPDST
jgi:hypothetical protein